MALRFLTVAIYSTQLSKKRIIYIILTVKIRKLQKIEVLDNLPDVSYENFIILKRNNQNEMFDEETLFLIDIKFDKS